MSPRLLLGLLGLLFITIGVFLWSSAGPGPAQRPETWDSAEGPLQDVRFTRGTKQGLLVTVALGDVPGRFLVASFVERTPGREEELRAALMEGRPTRIFFVPGARAEPQRFALRVDVDGRTVIDRSKEDPGGSLPPIASAIGVLIGLAGAALVRVAIRKGTAPG